MCLSLDVHPVIHSKTREADKWAKVENEAETEKEAKSVAEVEAEV